MPCGDARQRLDLKNGDVVDLGDVAEGEVPAREGDELAGVPLGRALKAEVWQATAAALPTNTLSGGVLTASANGSFTSIDGIAAVVGRRYLIKDEATQAKNGIYVLTDQGSVSTPWVMTRATDADDDDDWAQGLVVFVKQGTTNAKKLFRCTNTSPPVVDSTSIAFELYPAAAGGSGDFMADGSVPMTGDLDLGGQKGVNAADGTAADDLATVGQVAAAATPIGATMPWFGPASSIPSGWLKLDGSAISRSTYATLYGILGTTWGVGDGSTTFNLPDARTHFVKGANADGDLGAAGGSGTSGANATGITVGVANTVNRGVAGAVNTAGAQAAVVTDPGHTHSIDPPRVSAWWIIRAL